MADRRTAAVYSIPAHRAFADALAAGVLARFGDDPLALARGIILVPNNRTARSITNAFVRRADSGGGQGLLMPRLVPIGDPELDERLGSALDPIGSGADIPPAIAPMERQMILARMVQDARADAGQPIDAAEAVRLGSALGAALDQLQIERIGPERLADLQVEPDLSTHWQKSLALFRLLIDRWPQELAKRGRIDMTDRRNRLLDHVAERWRSESPAGFVVAAGIATAAPAVAGLLRRVSRMERGMVVLPDLDLNLTKEEWDAIGPFDPDPITGRASRAIETHPQFVLKLLLDRMGVAREEVAVWRWGGGHDAGAVRGRNISNAMLPARLTTKWRDLKPADRNLSGVTALECATPADEAQAIALAMREALETPEKTVALVTADRALATRVSEHLRRWGVEADDSAGRPLAQLPPGTLLVGLAQAAAEQFAPVALLALLKHPLVMQGEGRLLWLDQVRGLDLLLRGPRPPAGLAGIDALLRAGDTRLAKVREAVRRWWPSARALLAPLEEALAARDTSLSALLPVVREVAGALTGDAVWAGHQGREAARVFAELEGSAGLGPRRMDAAALPTLLREVFSPVAVRPPQGGHPRISIWGLIEARLQQADRVILSGLNEGNWPTLPAPDPWLAPRIRQELGLPSLERRIGLAAHEFANGLGAPEVLITRARRGAEGPAIASRFWLRLRAMAGKSWREARHYGDWAERIDTPADYRPTERPQPAPPAAERPVRIAVTDVDRLQADPFAFYARRVLALSALDPIDAQPSPAWRGTAVHAVLEAWAKEDGCDPARLAARAQALIEEEEAHPLMRTLWQPRLMQAIDWIAAAMAQDLATGRRPLLVEQWGEAKVAGVTLGGKADRIDRLSDGRIAVVDYKTGKPPSARQVAAGYSMQLGLIGLIAERGGFADLGDDPLAGAFEYWSLARSPRGEGFGYRTSPVNEDGKYNALVTSEFTAASAAQFTTAAGKWLTGDAPFTAKLHPEIPSYGEFDQLMRLDEWYGRGGGGSAA